MVRDPTPDIGGGGKTEWACPRVDGGREAPLLAIPSADAFPPLEVGVQLQVPRRAHCHASTRLWAAPALNADHTDDPPVKTRVVIHSRMNRG